MTKGIVVDHKELKTRYAISERNFNEKVHTRVRDLKPGESITSYPPKPIGQAIADEERAEEELAEARAAREALRPAQVQDEATDGRDEYIEKMLQQYKLEELQELAREEGLPTTGTKRELAVSLDQTWLAAEQAKQTGESAPAGTDGNNG